MRSQTHPYLKKKKALEWADSFITEEVEEARAGQNGGIDLRKELADIYRLTGGKISTLSRWFTTREGHMQILMVLLLSI